MTAHLRPYPKMKESGIGWIGEIPEHWSVWRLRNVAEMRVSNVDKYSRDGEIGVRLCNYVDVYRNDRIRSGLPYMRATATAGEIDRFGLRSGDVLITKDSEVWNDIGVPALVEEAAPDLVSGYHLALLRPHRKHTHPSYLFRALQSTAVASQLHVLANGVTRFGMAQRGIKAVRVPVPPLAEQAAIARFLDYADCRITRYLRAKRKLIGLLQEQERGLIQQIVTGQIDVRTGLPYAAYQPSRLSWAGDVPAHWAVASLRHRYTQCLGKMLDSNRITGKHLLPYLRNADVQWDRVNVADLPTMDIAPEEYDRYTVRRGDLLVCEGGEMGRCALWAGELPRCGFQKALHRLRPRAARRDVARFLYYALRCAAHKRAFADGKFSTIAHLTGDKLRAHRFPFPPHTEQEAIVRSLDATTENLSTALHAARRQVTLLRDYRTRLIADLVTGRLGVRRAAAALPDDAAG